MELGMTPVHRTSHTHEVQENKQRETLRPFGGGEGEIGNADAEAEWQTVSALRRSPLILEIAKGR